MATALNQKTSVGEDVEKGNPHALSVGLQIGAAAAENSMEVPQKNENWNCHVTQEFHSGKIQSKRKHRFAETRAPLCPLQHCRK